MAWALHSLLIIAMLVCFILVLIQMFQHGQTGLGIACIVLGFCGIGLVIAFIVGWVKSQEWRIQNLMIAWSVVWVVGIALGYAVPLPIAATP